jgi:hypothetical protein
LNSLGESPTYEREILEKVRGQLPIPSHREQREPMALICRGLAICTRTLSPKGGGGKDDLIMLNRRTVSGLMAQVDPWEKALECGRAIYAAKDPQDRAVLSNLQKLWVALGNEARLLMDQQILNMAEDLNRLHAQVLGGKA